jgi:hypothetical protein
VPRVPTDHHPERLEPPTVGERVAGNLRRYLLAAAQASLRALREMLAQLPRTDASALRLPPTTEPPPSAPRVAERVVAQPAAVPPPIDVLHGDTALPAAYGSDRLVILSRDPHCLYAYWDVSEARIAEVRARAATPAPRAVLRVYDVTQIAFDAKPPARFQDFAIAGDTRSLYAYVGKPAACFVAEVGYLRSDGAFFALARSEPVWTPRAEQPGTAPGRWMTVGWTERASAGRVVPLTTTGTGTVEPTPAALRQAPSSWPGPAPSAAQRGSWSLVRGKLAPTAVPEVSGE